MKTKLLLTDTSLGYVTRFLDDIMCDEISVQWLADELFAPLLFLRWLFLDFLGVALAERSPRHCGHAVDKLRLE